MELVAVRCWHHCLGVSSVFILRNSSRWPLYAWKGYPVGHDQFIHECCKISSPDLCSKIFRQSDSCPSLMFETF